VVVCVGQVIDAVAGMHHGSDHGSTKDALNTLGPACCCLKHIQLMLLGNVPCASVGLPAMHQQLQVSRSSLPHR
jgi:hypothetical protein